MDTQITKEDLENDNRTIRLIKFVHSRIEEKYKGFRQAFRSFDKDYGGDLDLKEFILGLENMGITLKYSDYKAIFDSIDYNQEGEIDYNKFLLLNTDNKRDKKIEQIEQLQAQKMKDNESLFSYSKVSRESKPPQHNGFRDGIIPKNKSI